jgi:hypothetical protein
VCRLHAHLGCHCCHRYEFLKSEMTIMMMMMMMKVLVDTLRGAVVAVQAEQTAARVGVSWRLTHWTSPSGRPQGQYSPPLCRSPQHPLATLHSLPLDLNVTGCDECVVLECDLSTCEVCFVLLCEAHRITTAPQAALHSGRHGGRRQPVDDGEDSVQRCV